MNFIQNNISKFYERYPKEKNVFLQEKILEKKNTRLVSSDKIDLSKELKKSRMLVFLGIGDGQLFRKLFHHLKKQNFIFVIMERSVDVMCALWNESDWSEEIVHEHVYWFLGQKNDYTREFEAAFHNINLVNSLGAYTFVKLHDREEDAQLYDEMLDQFIQMGARQIKNVAAFPEDSFQGLMNYVRNTVRLASIRRLEEFTDFYKNCTGVVVSAGPSLKHCLPLLHQIQDHVVIVCVDAVYKLLLSQGIIPHFVTSMERAGTFEFFENTDPQTHSCLITTPVLQPESLTAFQGPQVFFPAFGHGHEFFYSDIQGNDIGRSSATLAYAALAKMGCKSICLMGQDLAFDRFSDESHVSGIWNNVLEHGKKIHLNLKKQSKEDNPNWVEGNNGEAILTQDCWIAFKEDFMRLREKFGCTSINIIPPSYGAKIPGFTQVSPSDALSCFDLTSNSRTKNFLLSTQFASEEIHQREKNIVEKMRDAVNFFEEILVPKMLEINQALSMFFQYFSPMVDSEELELRYENFFHELEEAENQVLKSNKLIVNGLLLPFTQYSIPKMCVDIAKIRNQEISYCEKVQKIVYALLDHYKEIIYWSIRVSDLLKKRLDQKI